MAIANITQFLIQRVGHEPQDDEERELFEVVYNDHDGTNPSTNNIPMVGDDTDEG